MRRLVRTACLAVFSHAEKIEEEKKIGPTAASQKSRHARMCDSSPPGDAREGSLFLPSFPFFRKGAPTNTANRNKNEQISNTITVNSNSTHLLVMTEPSASRTATEAKFSLAMSSMLQTCFRFRCHGTGRGPSTKRRARAPRERQRRNRTAQHSTAKMMFGVLRGALPSSCLPSHRTL